MLMPLGFLSFLFCLFSELPIVIWPCLCLIAYLAKNIYCLFFAVVKLRVKTSHFIINLLLKLISIPKN
jgi:hypothetical protein